MTLLVVAWAIPIAANDSRDLNRFLLAYTRQIYDVLTRIHAHAMTQHDRYVIISASGDRYVQCVFHDNDTKIYCEAASGFYATPVYKKSRRSLYAIAEQGFSMDASKGNFSQEFIVRGPGSLWHIADVMLETLYRGYGAKIGNISIEAPIATHHKGVNEKVDIEFGARLVAIARGHPDTLPEPPPPESDDMFLVYQLLGKYAGTASWYAVNPWTGDVWDMGDCSTLSAPALLRAQEEIKKQFHGNELKEYERLHALRPYRISDLEPCARTKN